MSLEGSLETIALSEVLHLLSDTSKSGELLVSGDRGEGRLWFDAGRLSGFDVQRCSHPADAIFELLRQGTGRFAFEADASRPDDAHSVDEPDNDVRPILEVSQARLEEWTGIVAVVPSLDHHLSLAPQAPRENVRLSSEQWSLVVTIGEGRSVGEVLDRGGLSEFEGCRSLKTLVEARLATVEEPVVSVEPEPEVWEAQESLVAPEALTDFEVEPETLAELEVEPESLAALEAEPLTLTAMEAGTSDECVPQVEEFDSFGESSPQVVVNGGTFDGHDFVFKAPSADDYEPQPVPYPEPHSNGHAEGSVFDVEAGEDGDNGSMSSRAALEALLAEIPAEDGTDVATFEGASFDGAAQTEAHDALADRGPWSSQELASFDEMGGWHDESSAPAVPQEDAGGYDFSSTGDGQSHVTEEPQYQYESAVAHENSVVDDGAAEESEEELEEAQPEPVNRGLLLKFLSSVRS